MPPSSSIPRSRPMDARSSTRHGPTPAAGRVRVVPAEGGHGARCRDHAGALHRAVVLARRPAGRLSRRRRRPVSRAGIRCRAGTVRGRCRGNRGAPRLVREGGTDPQFDHSGKRLYFRERREDKFVLASVELSGADEQVHFRSDNATQIVPSPDGKWVAFAERYHAFVAAFPRSGRPVDLGPEVSAYPVARISRDAGMYLHWSGDSRRVLWTLGPDLYARELTHSFTFLESGREKADEPESKGVPIGFTAASDVPSGVDRHRGGARRDHGRRRGTERRRHDRCHRAWHHRDRGQPDQGPRACGRRDGTRGGGADRRAGRNGHTRTRRRARARLGRERWHPRRDELVVPRQPRRTA